MDVDDDFYCNWDEIAVITTASTYAAWTQSMAAMAEAMSTAAVTIADANWGEAVSDLVEGWNSISEEEPRIVMPRKVRLERRHVWQQRSEAQYHQRLAQSRSRLAMQARKKRRQYYAAKAR